MTESSGVNAIPPHLDRRTLLAIATLAPLLGTLSSVLLQSSSVQALVSTPRGMYYPTDPWRYDGDPGQEYLASRGGGRRHMGIDCQGGWGSAIYAVMSGTVVSGQWGSTASDGHGWGNFVKIDHGGGIATLYAHFSSAPAVSRGSRVTAGQRIGSMGGSQYGNLNGLPTHLHFEVFKNGGNVSPLDFLNENQASQEDEMLKDDERAALMQIASSVEKIRKALLDGRPEYYNGQYTPIDVLLSHTADTHTRVRGPKANVDMLQDILGKVSK